MSLFDRLARGLGYERRGDYVDTAPYALASKTMLPEQPAPWLLRTAHAEKYAIPDASVAAVQASLYRKLSWVQVAINAVADFCATTPFAVRRMEGENQVDIPNHPFETLLSRPNPLQSRAELLEWTFKYLLISGTSYLWLNRRSAMEPPVEMWHLPTHQVTPVPDGRLYLAGYDYDPQDGGPLVRLPVWQIVSVRLFNPTSWFVGLSPLEALSMAAHGDLAQQRYNLNLFDKNNAKIPGALAFADPVNNSDWEQMGDDLRQQWGGTNRGGPLRLRNVGKGGVQWLPMAMSQRDMEFLAGRQFTKEEIFSLYAPGLSSLLAVNATEANAKAGRDTFREMAIWPRLTLLAEKLTNDILPAYGGNLVGEFEDVRMRDRAMELAEAQEFSKTHTVNEIREREGSDPLPDERGELFVVQITPTSGGIQEPAPAPTFGSPNERQDEQDDSRDEEEPPDGEEQRRAEAKRFRAWAKRRKRPDAAKFASALLSDADKAALLAEMTQGDGAADDAPFPGWTNYP